METAIAQLQRRAIEFATEATNQRLIAMAMVGRAEVSLRRGDSAWARASAVRAAVTFRALPDFLLLSDALRVQADACDRIGLLGEADAAINDAVTLAREHQHRTQEAQSLQTHAQMMLRRGDRDQSRALGTAAREAFSAIGSVAAAEEMSEFLAALAR